MQSELIFNKKSFLQKNFAKYMQYIIIFYLLWLKNRKKDIFPQRIDHIKSW